MLPKILKTFAHTFGKRYSTKLALVVRGDIKMSKGKTGAQCAHAAVLCYQQTHTDDSKRDLLEAWCSSGQPKIVLRADTYDDLINLQARAKDDHVVEAIVMDAGRTQLTPGTVTVLGVGPDSAERIDKLVAHLKLL